MEIGEMVWVWTKTTSKGVSGCIRVGVGGKSSDLCDGRV